MQPVEYSGRAHRVNGSSSTMCRAAKVQLTLKKNNCGTQTAQSKSQEIYRSQYWAKLEAGESENLVFGQR